MRASLPALGDISMSRLATTSLASIPAAISGSSTALLPSHPLKQRTLSTTYALGNTHRRFNFSSRFYTYNTNGGFLSFQNRRGGVIATTTTAASSKRASSSSLKTRRVDRDVEEYWRQILEGVDKPTALRLIPYVDPSLPLGISDLSSFSTSRSSSPATATTAAAAYVDILSSADDITSPSSSSTRRGARPPMLTYFLETKLQHPTKVILCRVGEFYETVGIDAILLVQHAGLNPMGKEGNTPRAGCPKANLRRTVTDLVHGAGLSVVVCEETSQEYSYGKKKGPKQRYIADVVTPASPHYLSGLIDEDSDVVLDYAPPLLGISPQVGGFSVIEIDAEMQTVRVTEGLTEDAVYARLHEGGLAPPLYVHIPPTVGSTADRRLTEATPEVEWERRVSSVFKNNVGAVQKYNDKDPILGMIDRVKRQLNISPETEFRQLPAASPKTRPRPLYYSTASNLGLHKTRGLPSLIDCALPAGAPLTARRWLRDLLLLPRPPAVSVAVHAACAALQDAACAVPSFPVLIPNNVVLKIRNEQANDTFFRELGDLCRAVANACSEKQLEIFSKNILRVAGEETGVDLEIQNLGAECRLVLEKIHDVIDHDTVIGTGYIPKSLSLEEEATSSENSSDGGGVSGNNINLQLQNSSELPAGLKPFERLFEATEDFRGKIRPEKLEKALSDVENSRQRVLKEAAETLSLAVKVLLTTYSSSSSTSTTSSRATPAKPVYFYDVANNAAWIRFPRGISTSSNSATLAKNIGLIHPKDRNGKLETSFYSTTELETAQDDYRRACSDARDAVRAELRKLAQSLQEKLTHLVAAATFAVVASALDAHIREATRRGWALPHLTFTADILQKNETLQSTSPSPSSSSATSPFKVEGMWPYWLGGAGGIDPGTVKNSFFMDGLFLLTGPNMAGKSTLLRSTCAVALLGACGLAVPASSSSRVPYFDAYMLRNFSADSPLEGKSSFAVEMNEMRYVLNDATARSLVLIDELGKGTEARAGAALAGSMLEALDATGCRGVFATHLHSLLDMDLKIPGTKKMMMEIEHVKKESKNSSTTLEESNVSWVERKATWRMVPGESVESLALEVAMQERLPKDVVNRAAHLYSQIMSTINTNTGASGGGGGGGKGNDFSSVAGTTEIMNRNNPSTPSSGSPSTASRFNLSQAAVLLEKTATAVLQALTQNREIENEETVSSLGTNPNTNTNTLQAQFVPVGMIPPVRTIGTSCVYIARRSDGWYYVGSSDSLQDRIKAHRQRGGNTLVRDPKAEFAYVVVFDGSVDVKNGDSAGSSAGGAAGASAAKSVEAGVIKAMKSAGYPLLSDADARKRNAPVSKYLSDRSARYS